MKKYNFFSEYILIKLFFLVIFLNYFFFSIRLTLRNNPWIVGDWMINYEGGLLRRGLSGEIILITSEIIKINSSYILIFLQSALFLFFLVSFLLIIKKKKLNIWYIFLLLSPVTIAFTFHDPLAVGRKEVIFFLFYNLYLLYFLEKLNLSVYKFLFFFFVGISFTLIHEIFIFFTTFFLFSKYFYAKISNIKLNLNLFSNELILIAGSLMSVLALIFFSSHNPELKNLVCSRLIENGLNQEICTGALSEIVFSKYLNSYKSFGLIDYIIDNNYIFVYLLSTLLFFIPLFFFLSSIIYTSKEIKLFLYFIIFQLILISSIFVVVNDWGRYLNTYFIYILIFISYFFLEKIKLQKAKYNKLIIIILILYFSTWHMPHCCQTNIGNGFFNFKHRIIYRINNPSNYEDKTRDLINKLIR